MDRKMRQAISMRQRAAKKIAKDSKRECLSEFDKYFFRYGSVQLRIPLRDPVECKHHLTMARNALDELLLALERPGKDRAALLTVQARLAYLNKKINAKRV